MSTAAEVIERCVEKIQELSAIGRVHERLRLATNEDDFLELLTIEIAGKQTLRTWFVKLGPMRTSQADSASRVQWDREILVEGYCQFEDASGSETTTLAMAERIARKLFYDAQTTQLGGQILLAKPPEIEDTEPVTFAGVVCSFVRIRMIVTSLEDLIDPT